MTTSSPFSRLRARLAAVMARRRERLRTRTFSDPTLNPPGLPARLLSVRTGDGADLRVHLYGPPEGQLVVFSHGWTCCLEFWNRQLAEFAEHCRVVVYDQRGHGASSLGTARPDVDVLASDLHEVLTAVAGSGARAVLVGHSMGGMAIQAWAQKYGKVERFAAAIVMTNTAANRLVAETTVVPLFNRPLKRFGRGISLPLWLGRWGLGAPFVLPPIALVKRIFADRVMTLSAAPEVVDFALGIVRSCPIRARGIFGKVLADMELGQAAAAITVPTTVIAGSGDDLTPLVHAERIVQTLRGAGTEARLVTLPTGHLGPVEAPVEFNAELSRVLEWVGTEQCRGVS